MLSKIKLYGKSLFLQVLTCTTERLAHLCALVHWISWHRRVLSCAVFAAYLISLRICKIYCYCSWNKHLSVRRMWLILYKIIPQKHILLDWTLHREEVVVGMHSSLPTSLLFFPFGSLLSYRLSEQRREPPQLSFLRIAALAEGWVWYYAYF